MNTLTQALRLTYNKHTVLIAAIFFSSSTVALSTAYSYYVEYNTVSAQALRMIGWN